MAIRWHPVDAKGIRFSIEEDGHEVAHAFLYIMHNDLHAEPFGLLEDVFVSEDQRSRGYGTRLIKQVIDIASEFQCYKLIATSRTSRSDVHRLYTQLGFASCGVEFRLDLV
ncbi:MAG: GNAT family N-acetyltransferase [Elainellaceae cyanobacterium]